MKTGKNVPYTDADRHYWRSRGNRRVRKKRWARWTLRWAALIAVHLVLVVAVVLVGTRLLRHVVDTDEFALAEIRIDGLARVGDPEIQAMLAPYLHENVFDLDLTEIAGSLARNPWIEDASVRRVLPRNLQIRVRERTPVARFEAPDGLVWVDASGVFLPPRGRPDDARLPTILGTERLDRGRIEAHVRASLGTLARLHEADPEWYAEIAAIELREDTVTIRSRRGERVLLDRDVPERNLTAWLALRPEIGRRVGATRYVDLRWRGRVTVLPAAHDTRNVPASSRRGR